ncbi:hypothetical protein A4A49_13665 [Nicotiana attenuata]|uniref:Uncharacterized protein n=1 Tax=Nicotiana attenuata TaxID=49451 RepID=A0A1J6II87_NICAT|nr:hypothetical protein A4A49_13665 [Nicotiana attenuata]
MISSVDTSSWMNLLAKQIGVDTFADYTKAQLGNIMKTTDPNQQQQQALTSSVNTTSWMKWLVKPTNVETC